MRIDVKKYLFFGARSSLEDFFREAQDLGIIQFIDPSQRKIKEVPRDINRIQQAIRVLHGFPTMEQLEIDDYDKADELAREICDLYNSIEALREERRELRQEIARVEVFGDFSPEDVAYIERESGRVVQFYCAKRHAKVSLKEEDDVLFVGSEHGLDYFVAFNKARRSVPGMLEMLIEKPLQELRQRYQAISGDIHLREEKLRTYANRDTFLHEALLNRHNEYSLQLAKGCSRDCVEATTFYVEGWAPVNKTKKLHDLIHHHAVESEEIAVEERDRIPTCLHNEGFSRIGEDLVHIYDTPSIEDRDPSPWVLWAFSLFFAMILGDGGYGALFLIGALALRFKNPRPSPGTKRFVTLATLLSLSCIVWGLLTNSFFGLKIAPDHPVMSVSLVQRAVEAKADYHLEKKDETYFEWVKKFPAVLSANDYQEFLDGAATELDGRTRYVMRDTFYDNVMMELALLVGVIHICLSFMRSLDKHWAGIGWIAALIGGYLYFAAYLDATSMLHYVCGMDKAVSATAGFELMAGGIAVACVLAIFQHKLSGVLEILSIIQIFSDVLSYLRLYALGLAGSMVSSTFNQMGASITVVAGALVIIFGHVVNIALSIMGGVIHGLRLNFLEWYHYSFEGGGFLFKPLKLDKIK